MTAKNDFQINFPGVAKPKGFVGVSKAIEAAQAFTAANQVELQVVHIPTEAVAFVATPVPAGQHFSPWTRVETPKFTARHYEGYTPAYTRKRIDAVVYRKNDLTGWMVVIGGTEQHRFNTTKEACNFTTQAAKDARANR